MQKLELEKKKGTNTFLRMRKDTQRDNQKI